jgi:hypothetical protein
LLFLWSSGLRFYCRLAKKQIKQNGNEKKRNYAQKSRNIFHPTFLQIKLFGQKKIVKSVYKVK